MRRDIESLAEGKFDLLVIGGGIFGACVAWEAAHRGLSVALIEQGDFAGSTSGNSFKFVHGGIRYLQTADVRRMRHACRERRSLLQIAPHLVHTVPIVIPAYGRGRRGRSMLRAGLSLYDLMTIDRNRGVSDSHLRIPPGTTIGRAEVLDMFPGLDPRGLTGGGIYWDGQIRNPARLVLAYLKSAVCRGAVVANYLRASAFLREGHRILGVSAIDLQTGCELTIRASAVVNAAGPYADRLLEPAAAMPRHPGNYSRDACFTVPRHLLSKTHALALLSHESATDALITRGTRHLFVVPWRDCTLIGVWHSAATDRTATIVTDRELDGFVEEVNGAYPSLGFSADDISFYSAGLVPVSRYDSASGMVRFGRRSRMIDHAKRHGISNLVTLIGLRFGMARRDASSAVDLIFRGLSRRSPKSRTAHLPLVGADIGDYRAFVASVERATRLPPPSVRCLVDSFGSEYTQVLRLVEQDPALSVTLGNSPVLKAQVLYAVREEMARTLADVVLRRTDLATGDYPGQAVLQECAELIAGELAWNQRRIEQEVGSVKSRFMSKRVTEVDRLAHSFA